MAERPAASASRALVNRVAAPAAVIVEEAHNREDRLPGCATGKVSEELTVRVVLDDRLLLGADRLLLLKGLDHVLHLPQGALEAPAFSAEDPLELVRTVALATDQLLRHWGGPPPDQGSREDIAYHK